MRGDVRLAGLVGAVMVFAGGSYEEPEVFGLEYGKPRNAKERRRKARAHKHAEWLERTAADRSDDQLRAEIRARGTSLGGDITGGRSRMTSIALRTGKHKDQHIDRQRSAGFRKKRTTLRKRIAKASKRRNRS